MTYSKNNFFLQNKHQSYNQAAEDTDRASFNFRNIGILSFCCLKYTERQAAPRVSTTSEMIALIIQKVWIFFWNYEDSKVPCEKSYLTLKIVNCYIKYLQLNLFSVSYYQTVGRTFAMECKNLSYNQNLFKNRISFYSWEKSVLANTKKFSWSTLQSSALGISEILEEMPAVVYFLK